MESQDKKTLRRGWTTGACAAAAARAAFVALRTGRFPDQVFVRLPGGLTPAFAVAHAHLGPDYAEAGIRKDAGDDPDVTHGALILAKVRSLAPGQGIIFRAGEGVGAVTLPGLPVAVGEPAINPGPRAQIRDNLQAAADEIGGPLDLEITLSIPGGEGLAEKTLNGRLGIKGGLSILGTSGVVVPYSCAAWVHAIHRGVDVARAMRLPHLAAATGRTSETAARALLALPDPAWIDMGDMAGALLKYLRRRPMPRLTLAGGFAKIAKLAAGHLDLHSKQSALDHPWLALQLAALGAAPSVIDEARSAQTAARVLELAGALPLAARMAEMARAVAQDAAGPQTLVDVLVFDRKGRQVGHAGN